MRDALSNQPKVLGLTHPSVPPCSIPNSALPSLPARISLPPVYPSLLYPPFATPFYTYFCYPPLIYTIFATLLSLPSLISPPTPFFSSLPSRVSTPAPVCLARLLLHGAQEPARLRGAGLLLSLRPAGPSTGAAGTDMGAHPRPVAPVCHRPSSQGTSCSPQAPRVWIYTPPLRPYPPDPHLLARWSTLPLIFFPLAKRHSCCMLRASWSSCSFSQTFRATWNSRPCAAHTCGWVVA